MAEASRMKGAALRGAWLTAAYVVGGILAGFFVGRLAFDVLPGHLRTGTRDTLATVASAIAVGGGGMLWGRAMGKLAKAENTSGPGWAGAVALSAAFLGAVYGLGALERIIVEEGRGPDLPIHWAFTLLFVPAAALVAGISAGAIGAGLRRPGLAGRLGLRAGLGGGLGFLAVNLFMYAIGYVVGAPGAVERATMITVMLLGMLGAALAGGAVVGREIASYKL